MLHGDVLGERARLTPGALALVEVASGARLTYRELDRRATACARVLREGLGLARGDRFALLAGNRVEFLDAFFAAGKCGAVVVPVNTNLTAREVAPILRDAGCRVLVYDRRGAPVAAALAGEALPVERWVAVEATADAGHERLPDLLGRLAPHPEPLPPADPGDLYCLLYTSGTTGTPKGVMIPHRMVAWNGYNTAVSWQLCATDVSPVFTPLYHAGGLGAFLVPILTAGGTVVLHEKFDAAEVLRAIARERCTVILVVPTIARMLLDDPEFGRLDLSHVRFFISGGAPLPPELVAAYRERGLVLRQGYGLTEVGVNCFAMTDADAWERRGSVGTPLAFTQARIVDDAGRELPAGVVGELVFHGPHVCAGYWNDPAATAAAIDADGWFHTGDLARRDADGYFAIAGRAKDMYISGGVNVYPAEVEAALAQHPGVADVAVVGVPHAKWGEVGVAFVVARPPCPPTGDELAAFLGDRLARFKIPHDWVFLEALPRTAYGKAVKPALRALWADREGAR